MRRFVCLVLLMAFFCVSALAENASVRGLEYGMTVSEIMEVERNKRNNEPTNFTDTSVKYEGIDVNGEIADVRYSIEDG